MVSAKECIICYEYISQKDGFIVLRCNHEYCLKCFVEHMKNDNRCATCRRDVVSKHPYRDDHVHVSNVYEVLIDERIDLTSLLDSDATKYVRKIISMYT